MALYYQPVGLPSIGGRSGQVSQSALTIGAGLNSLGNKITGLGDRRQRRLEEEQDRKNARGLEILKLAAANTTDEDELNQIFGSLGLLPEGDVGSAVVIPGASAVQNAARARIIGDRNDRAIAGYNETRFKSAQSEIEESELDKQYQLEYGELLSRITNFSIQGRQDEAQELIDGFVSSASSVYGADRVNNSIRAALGDFNSGQESRYKVADNALDIEKSQIANRDSNYAFQRNVIANNRADDRFESNERIVDAVSYAQTQLPTRRSQEQYLKEQANLTDEEYVTALQALDAGPGLDTTQPILDTLGLNRPKQDGPPSPLNYLQRTVVEALGGEVRTTPAEVPIAGTAAGARGAITTVLEKSPNLKIMRTAQELEEEFKGFTGNLGVYLNDRFPNYDLSGDEQTLIEKMHKSSGLSEAEITAIVGNNIKIPGGAFGIGNRPELHDDDFVAQVKAYKAEKANTRADYELVQRDQISIDNIVAQINSRQRDLDRMAQSPNADPEEKALLEEELSVLTNKLIATEQRYGRRLGNTSNEEDPPKAASSPDVRRTMNTYAFPG